MLRFFFVLFSLLFFSLSAYGQNPDGITFAQGQTIITRLTEIRNSSDTSIVRLTQIRDYMFEEMDAAIDSIGWNTWDIKNNTDFIVDQLNHIDSLLNGVYEFVSEELPRIERSLYDEVIDVPYLSIIRQYVRDGLMDVQGEVAYLERVRSDLRSLFEAFISMTGGSLDGLGGWQIGRTTLVQMSDYLSQIRDNTGIGGILSNQLNTMTGILNRIADIVGALNRIEAHVSRLEAIYVSLLDVESALRDEFGVIDYLKRIRMGVDTFRFEDWPAYRTQVEGIRSVLDQMLSIISAGGGGDMGDLASDVAAIKTAAQGIRSYVADYIHLLMHLRAIDEALYDGSGQSYLALISSSASVAAEQLLLISDLLEELKDGLLGDLPADPSVPEFEPGEPHLLGVLYDGEGRTITQAVDDSLHAQASAKSMDWLPDIEQQTEAPVWRITMPFQGSGSRFLPFWESFTLEVDWSFFAPYRPLLHACLMFFVSLQASAMVWEETRKYG